MNKRYFGIISAILSFVIIYLCSEAQLKTLTYTPNGLIFMHYFIIFISLFGSIAFLVIFISEINGDRYE